MDGGRDVGAAGFSFDEGVLLRLFDREPEERGSSSPIDLLLSAPSAGSITTPLCLADGLMRRVTKARCMH